VDEPPDEEWQKTFGVAPAEDQPSNGEPWVRRVDLVPSSSEELRISWDAVGDDVRVVWTDAGTTRLDLYREAVWRLSIDDGEPNATAIVLDYKQDRVSWTARVQVWPSFRYADWPHHRG
jgi:hypothetical protein